MVFTLLLILLIYLVRWLLLLCLDDIENSEYNDNEYIFHEYIINECIELEYMKSVINE